MYNGIINIYKEKGYTSFDVVAKLRGIFHQKKIGHTGTLDPDAEGVLPVCLGNATKVCELLMDQDKEYETVLLLGKETDTQDISGTVLSECNVVSNEEQVRRTIMNYVGSYNQVPPMYSARKVNGKKLYELARAGVTVERQAKEVTIHEISIISIELPRVRMRVRCSKGTYIRTLCHDIGQELGCGGCMEELLRTRVGDFRIENSLRISQVEEVMLSLSHTAGCESSDADKLTCEATNITEILQNVDTLFESLPEIFVNVNLTKSVVNGNKIPLGQLQTSLDLADGERVRLYLEQDGDAGAKFIGIYSYNAVLQEFKPVKLFF